MKKTFVVIFMLFVNFLMGTNTISGSNLADEVRKTEVVPANNSPITLQVIQYSEYCNSRYNYCIDYPKNILFEQLESINGDGTIFKTRDGKEKLRAYGTLNMDMLTATDLTLDQQFKAELHSFSQDKSTITYKKIGESFFVISGYDSGTIFYLKVIKRLDHMGYDAFAYALLRYNDSEKDIYDQVAVHIMKTFK